MSTETSSHDSSSDSDNPFRPLPEASDRHRLDDGPPPWVTLLTDFGPKDTYIGVMKGVIATIARQAVVVDLSHGVAPQKVAEGAFLLETSYRYFPPGTIHVAVVDPGVGGGRAILAAEIDGFTFVAPDNGLLGGVLRGRTPDRVHRVEESRFFLRSVSGTFHARDIFAPVAAHIANGVELSDLGPAHRSAIAAPWPQPQSSAGEVAGQVIYCDHFGNCISNIQIPEAASGCVDIGSGVPLPLLHHYGEVAVGEALALRGSSGYLEIAVRDGNARKELRLAEGKPIVWTGGV